MGYVLVLFILLMGFLLYRKLLPAILCLPLFAIVIAKAALLPTAGAAWRDGGLLGYIGHFSPVLDVVISQGAAMLVSAYIAVVLGAILAAHIRENGVAEQIVRFAAEYGGDSPFALSLVLTLVTALLFTTLGGLGAVIMVATLTLPVLRSVGVSGKIAGASFLFALSLGGTLNPVNWQIYKDVLGLEADTIIRFALVMFGVFAVLTVLYLAWKLVRSVRGRVITVAVALLLVIAVAALQLTGAFAKIKDYLLWTLLGMMLAALFVLWVGAFVTMAMVYFGWRKGAAQNGGASNSGGETTKPKPRVFAYAAILVPLLFLLADALARASVPGYADSGIAMPFIAALALGVIYSFVASFVRDGKNADLLMKSCFEGFRDAAPAVLLMLGIGMLLKATMMPETSALVEPLIRAAIPRSPLAYVIAFTVLAPLSLYRGPLNLWGMGSGVVGIVKAAGALSAAHVMGAFFSVGMMQGICDPTNTHNVWIANHEGVDVLDLSKETLPWVWAGVAAGLVAASAMMGGWG
ncbi:MAG: hypothetical protein HRF49_12435 [bacterium]|jgi:hypothetical protein